MASKKNIKSKAQKRAAQTPLIKSPPPLPDDVLEVLHQQHTQLYKGIAIVSCARYASESKIVGAPDLDGGLEVAEKILGNVVEEIEDLIPLSYFHDKLDEADES